MKIRTDFVTNSSSSSFVCIQFKSKKLKELLTKYNVKYWKSNSKWDVYYKDEDISCSAMEYNSKQSVLNWFMEDLLLMMNSGNGFIDEYRANKQMYFDDIVNLHYEIDDSKYGEFDGSPELHYSFEMDNKKKKVSDKQLKECMNKVMSSDLSGCPLAVKYRYLGDLHIYLTPDNSELYLVREPDNDYDENAIFVEDTSHKYLGYLWGSTAEFLAPVLDSGKYKYRARMNSEKKGVTIEIEQADSADNEWRFAEIGSPMLAEEELRDIRVSYDAWLDDLKKKYENKKLPKTVKTLLKNGSVDPYVAKRWADVLFSDSKEPNLSLDELGAIFTKEGLLDQQS